MNSLEVLLKAEATLMDENEPFDFGDWHTCTCGHIYHGVTGEYGVNKVREIAAWSLEDTSPYIEVMTEVANALGLKDKNFAYKNFAYAISEYTKKVSGIRRDPYSDFPYGQVTREDSLKVIREAITKIRALDETARLRVIDPHTYGLDHGA